MIGAHQHQSEMVKIRLSLHPSPETWNGGFFFFFFQGEETMSNGLLKAYKEYHHLTEKHWLRIGNWSSYYGRECV